MQYGVVFPHTEIGADRGDVERYVRGVDALGFGHLVAYDHVLGADRAHHAGWERRYDVDTPFHEPFVLFGFIAAISSLELATAIVILPQRQTALVAKQAAEVDRLCEGRFRLGVGIGWNAVEYEALGKTFTNRGARLSEQVELLRRLWTERSVTFDGVYEKVTAAGIAPLPIQQPIPIWFGCQSEPAYRRAGQLGDGWYPQVPPGPQLEAARHVVHEAAREAGRDPAALGMEGRMAVVGLSPDELQKEAHAWEKSGATHLSLNTMNAGLLGAQAHLDELARVAEALALRAR